jgi:ribonuclease P protein component
MFPKKHKLSSKEFQTVYDRGVKFKGQYGMVITYHLPTFNDYKVGFVVSKKVGNAVKRHLTVRRLRALFRKEISSIDTPLLYQYVSFQFPDSFSELEKEVSSQFESIRKYYLK